MQFVENLSDRQAAEAVRARIDWKYVLGLELTDADFDHSVLCEFRERLVKGDAQSLLLDRMLEYLGEKKLLRARGRQRTDSTHVLASIRVMNWLELITETLRAALNELAILAPDWLRGVAPSQWYQRYSLRAEQSRLPRGEQARHHYAQSVGQDGLYLLDREKAELRTLEKIVILRQVWERHFEIREDSDPEAQPIEAGNGQAVKGNSTVVLRANAELARAAHAIESPYDTQARHSNKRDLSWTGYKVHLSETCDPALPRLITQVHTTVATTQDVSCTAPIHHALARKKLLPSLHLVDAGYIDAKLLLGSLRRYGVELFGPTRINPSWQARAGGYEQSHFIIDWENQRVTCPQGKISRWWNTCLGKDGESTRVKVSFSPQDCSPCLERTKCVRSSCFVPRLEWTVF